MAQLSVHLDDRTLASSKHAATLEHRSVSQWAREKLAPSLAAEWPEGYWELFGSLTGLQLGRPDQPSLRRDAARGKL